MEIRVKLPEELVSQLHGNGNRKERDRRIQIALEEYLQVPVLDAVADEEATPRRRRHASSRGQR